MKILVLSAQPPSLYSGGEIRLYNLLKYFPDRHEFTVIAPLHEMDAGHSNQSLLDLANQYCHFIPVWLPPAPPRRSRTYYRWNAWREAIFEPRPHMAKTFYSPLIQQRILEQLKTEQYECIQVEQLMMMQYLPKAKQKAGLPILLDVDNLWTTLATRLNAIAPPEASISRRLQKRIELRKIRRYEAQSLRRSTACLAISARDQQIIQAIAPGKPIYLVPNGVDTQYFSPQNKVSAVRNHGGVPANPVLLFTGTMSWQPNQQAALMLANEILPQLLDRHPGLKLLIVGREPGAAVIELAKNPAITVTGFVEDVRPYYNQADIFVVPLRAGAGSRLKILEALAMKVPVISTTIGAEGLDLQDGQHLLIAETAEDFSRQIIRLLDSNERSPGYQLRKTLQEHGRQQVESKYDWRAITQPDGALDQAYRSLASQSPLE